MADNENKNNKAEKPADSSSEKEVKAVDASAKADAPAEAEKTTEETKATGPAPADLKGAIGHKVGMTEVIVDGGDMKAVTIVSSEGMVITQVKTPEKDGYAAVQVGIEDVAERKLSKAELNHLKKNNLAPKRWLHEFRVDDVSKFEIGQPIPVTVFAKGDYVQVSGLTKGKGYAGTIKRHNFSGGPHSHGHGEYRRSPGSSGGQGPQHVLPGTKKPGHLGHKSKTILNLQVVDVLPEKNLFVLAGSIPGPNGGRVVIRPTSRTIKTQATAGKKGK